MEEKKKLKVVKGSFLALTSPWLPIVSQLETNEPGMKLIVHVAGAICLNQQKQPNWFL